MYFLCCIAGLARENRTISEDILRGAFSATEDGFLTLVRRSRGIKPAIAAIGSCCLVGVIWRGTLYVANLGDSRAVVGRLGKSRKIVAEQLTSDHNASREDIRQELRSLHPDDSHIVVLKNGVWRIKGIIQVLFFFISFFPSSFHAICSLLISYIPFDLILFLVVDVSFLLLSPAFFLFFFFLLFLFLLTLPAFEVCTFPISLFRMLLCMHTKSTTAMNSYKA